MESFWTLTVILLALSSGTEGDSDQYPASWSACSASCGEGVKTRVITQKCYEKPCISFLDIHIRSEACDDPGRVPGTCGYTYIKVNGTDHSLHLRGHNVVIVDSKTGSFLEASVFDTHDDSSAGNKLRDYLNGISGDKIVLVAIQDSGNTYLSPAIDALKRLGATDPILTEFRSSFALAGYAGANKPPWITQKQNKRYKGPSEINLKIRLTQP